MKVILKKTGKIKNVPDGYARNYLLPKGLAVLATSDAIKQVELTEQQKKAEEQQQVAQWEHMAKELSQGKLVIAMKANADGTLFGKVSTSAILEVVQKEKNMQLQESWVQLPADVKHVGTIEVMVLFPSGVQGTIHLTIQAE